MFILLITVNYSSHARSTDFEQRGVIRELKRGEPPYHGKAGTAAVAGGHHVVKNEEGHVSGWSALACPIIPRSSDGAIISSGVIISTRYSVPKLVKALYMYTLRWNGSKVKMRFS